MAWWAWMLLAWATLATVGVLVLSAALYERADHIRALTIDEEWPQDRPDHYTWPEPVDLGGYTDGGRAAERPAQPIRAQMRRVKSHGLRFPRSQDSFVSGGAVSAAQRSAGCCRMIP
jgi:hypothetical protein